MREAVGFILYASDGKILLQHRTDDAPKYPSKWGFFAGRVEQGETISEAVKREAQEELNYNYNTQNFCFKKKLDEEILYVYIEKYDKTQKLILNEGQNMGWFHLDELNNIDIIDIDYKILIEDVKKHIKK